MVNSTILDFKMAVTKMCFLVSKTMFYGLENQFMTHSGSYDVSCIGFQDGRHQKYLFFFILFI